ncbi:DNA cytosine methyltransferase [bacterium]|nr:DNA cytosine methyltransferase [bacterium]
MKKNKTYRAISLFCGAGGLDLGFKKAGIDVIWANDIDLNSCITHLQNFGECAVTKANIRNIPSSDIPNADVIIGGFPCQGFSLAGPRLVADERNYLYKEFVRILHDKKPAAFVAENVKGILTLGNGEIITAIVNEFKKKEYEYEVEYHLLNAADYGVAQDRQRVILVGLRKDLKKTYSFPNKSNGRITIAEVLKGFPKPQEDEICNQPYSPRYLSRNRRKNWEDVSFTIPAMAKQVPLHPSSPVMKKITKDKWEFGDKQKTRRFSWREAAAIQGFPKDYNFYGDLISKYQQIGNAVPSPLAYAIALKLKEVLD